jgi:hypothetical protein
MRNLLPLKLVTVAVLVAGLGSARALTFQDLHTINQALNGGHPSHAGTFNITTDGFNPALHVLTSATATFVFTATGASEKTVNILLAEQAFASQSFTGNTTISDGVSASILANLQADGLLAYTVNRQDGNFTLVSAQLIANGDRIGNGNGLPSVPDGGATVGLLGLALLGLAGLRRRLQV